MYGSESPRKSSAPLVHLFISRSFSTYHVIDAVMLTVTLLSVRIVQSRKGDTKHTCVAHAKYKSDEVQL